MLGIGSQQRQRRHSHKRSEPLDRREARVPLAAFEAAYIGAVQAELVGERLLAEPGSGPVPAEVSAHQSSKLPFGHDTEFDLSATVPSTDRYVAKGVAMSEYIIDPSGSVRAGSNGPEVAFFDADGTIRSQRGGSVIGYVDDAGKVTTQRGGSSVGAVRSDGTVLNPNGQTVGTVQAPVHRRGALLLLLG
jgi:hypothetical protein